VYAEEFIKEYLLNLVISYKLYNQVMGKERLFGQKLLEEGVALYDQGRWEDALSNEAKQ
jgi:hypothetical protein